MKNLLAVLLSTLPLLAQEQSNQPPEKDMSLWLWLNFFILIGGFVWLSRKYLAPFLTARTAGIGKEIAAAEKAKAEADATVAGVNAKLANLSGDIAALKEENRREQARETERIQARNQAEIARIQQQTRQEIESATKAARLELKRQAAKLALDLAQQKVAARMNPEAQNQLASDFVESLS